MHGVYQYIREKYGDHKWSEIIYQQNDATGKVVASFDQRNARGILCHNLYWINAGLVGGAGTKTWIDGFNQVIFAQFNFSTNGWAPIPLVVETTKLIITCSDNTLVWFLSYQYIL